MGRMAASIFFLVFSLMYTVVCSGIDFSGAGESSSMSAGSSWDAGGWQPSGAALERTVVTGSQTEQVASREEVFGGVVAEAFSVTGDGGQLDWGSMDFRVQGDEFGTFVSTTSSNVETLTPYSSLAIDTSVGLRSPAIETGGKSGRAPLALSSMGSNRPVVSLSGGLTEPLAVPIKFEDILDSLASSAPASDFAQVSEDLAALAPGINAEQFAQSKIPAGERPQTIGLDGNPRNSFAFEAKPFDFGAYMENAANADNQPVKLDGSAGGPVFNTRALNLTAAEKTETITQERETGEFSYSDRLEYAQFIPSQPVPPVDPVVNPPVTGPVQTPTPTTPTPKPDSSGGGGDGDSGGAQYYSSVHGSDGSTIYAGEANTREEAADRAATAAEHASRDGNGNIEASVSVVER